MTLLQSPEQAILTDIHSAAEEAYNTIRAEALPIDAQRTRAVATRASELLIGSLGDLEVSSERRLAWPESDPTFPVFFQEGAQATLHHYVVVHTPDGEVIVDGNWKRFLDKGASVEDMPDVLVGSREEVDAAVQFYGITDPGILKIWASRSRHEQSEDL